MSQKFNTGGATLLDVFNIAECEILPLIFDTIPGSTNSQKLAWVQAMVANNDTILDSPQILTAIMCQDADAAARRMAAALGEIEAVIEEVLPNNINIGILRIAEIVAGVE